MTRIEKNLTKGKEIAKEAKSLFANDIRADCYQNLGILHQEITEMELKQWVLEERLLIGSTEKSGEFQNVYQLIKRIKWVKFEQGLLLNQDGIYIFDTQFKLDLLLQTYLEKQCVYLDKALTSDVMKIVNVRYGPSQGGHIDERFKGRTNFLVSEVFETIKSFKNKKEWGPSGTSLLKTIPKSAKTSCPNFMRFISLSDMEIKGQFKN